MQYPNITGSQIIEHPQPLIDLDAIALYRVGGYVVVFRDSRKGWDFLTLFARLPVERRAEGAALITNMYAEKGEDQNMTPAGTQAEGMVVATMEALDLPADLPDGKLVGLHPSLADPDVPRYEPGASS